MKQIMKQIKHDTLLCLRLKSAVFEFVIFLKMPFSNEEAFNLLAIYFECFQNATIAARTFYLRYPNRPRYHRRVFVRLAQRLLITGSIHRPTMNRRNRQNNEETIVNVLASIELNPQISTREISRDLGIPRSSVHRILQTQRYGKLLNIRYALLTKCKNDMIKIGTHF